ncbi:MAG: DUF1553 domain-containing protein, partial [Planctomycetes bacterium]|nr:DUF1553 domain-containing protein [Planctomycetota bacterium]
RQLATAAPDESSKRAAFFAEVNKKLGLVWGPTKLTAAESTQGATLKAQPDGSVLASGKNPDQDEHVITLRTDGKDLRVLMLEALADPSLPARRVGRAPNGNAVLSGIEAEAASVAEPTTRKPVKFTWAWADVEQEDGDFRVVNVLTSGPPADRGWAVDAHRREGGRVALLLADQPFGFDGGTELRVRLKYESVYAQHALGRVRLSVARVADAGLDLLPAAASGWYFVGPLPVESDREGYSTAFGPEKDTALDLTRNFGFGNQYWRFNADYRDERANKLPDGSNVTYVGRRVWSPTVRKVDVLLGSDDGFILFVNGKQAASVRASRAVQPDQDKATIELKAGLNVVVMKIINIAGPGGFYYRAAARPGELTGQLAAAAVPETTRSEDLKQRLDQAWMTAYSPGYLARRAKLVELEKRMAEVEASQPRTMVMKELPKPRETFVLTRGQYDRPDKSRPVTRGLPAVLGKLPAGAPQDRLGLAQWLVSPENPLVARVAVNRYWEMLFGTGIVRTSEDFGLQGEWPSHPELLDWLAVEFRESGWDVQHMLRLIMTSSTYRQDSRVRPELREGDPENRRLAYFPRRRLAAEFVRDEALYVSGLLVEQLGGASVKPYQPDGLWREVAMVQSNTRIFKRGDGPDLWRRSLYTYWKRACPPPSLMTFDAPTREACTIRRSQTNTPLQALVLWNDEQYVEAARVLAERIMREASDDDARLVSLFRRCLGRVPDEFELRRVGETLEAFRERYRRSPEDAAKLVAAGEAPPAENVSKSELAAWTMIANSVLNLSETITQH